MGKIKIDIRLSDNLILMAEKENDFNHKKMIKNFNAPLHKIQAYENKEFLNLVDSIIKELKYGKHIKED